MAHARLTGQRRNEIRSLDRLRHIKLRGPRLEIAIPPRQVGRQAQ
jgi:hypothetical protein